MELCARGFSVAPNPYYRTTNHGEYANTAQIGGAGTNVTVGIQSYLNTDNGSLNVVSRVWSATDPFGNNDGTLVSITPTASGNNETAEFEFTVGAGDEYYLLKEVVTYSDGSTSETSSFLHFFENAGVLTISDFILQSVKFPNSTDVFDTSGYVDLSGSPVTLPYTTSEFDITQPNDFAYDVSLPYGSTYTVAATGNNFSVNISNDALLGLAYQTVIYNI